MITRTQCAISAHFFRMETNKFSEIVLVGPRFLFFTGFLHN